MRSGDSSFQLVGTPATGAGLKIDATGKVGSLSLLALIDAVLSLLPATISLCPSAASLFAAFVMGACVALTDSRACMALARSPFFQITISAVWSCTAGSLIRGSGQIVVAPTGTFNAQGVLVDGPTTTGETESASFRCCFSMTAELRIGVVFC